MEFCYRSISLNYYENRWIEVSQKIHSLLVWKVHRTTVVRQRNTWPMDRTLPRHEYTRRDDEVQGWKSHESSSQSCP